MYFGYIKDIFGDDGNNDYNGLSVKLQVKCTTTGKISGIFSESVHTVDRNSKQNLQYHTWMREGG